MTKILTAEIFGAAIHDASGICILGHTGPDGDCVGSCLGAYNYICGVLGDGKAPVAVYLDDPNAKFSFLSGFSDVHTVPDNESYELVIVLDCASLDRLGKFRRYFDRAGCTLLIDHHATNQGFADYAVIDGEASSASEVLYTLMDDKYFTRAVAECIYTGIVHDTGVFRYSCTHRSTMDIAGRCMDLGVDFGSVIEDSFFSMSYDQKRMLGYILFHMESLCGGKLMYASADMETRKSIGGADLDLDGMIDNMRTTSGAMAAAFLYETAEGRVKASLRSNSDLIDVSLIAQAYGGGGHKRAAGCFMPADLIDDRARIEELFNKQLEKAPEI